MKKVDIKKELTEKEFEEIVSNFELKYKSVDNFNDIISKCEVLVKEITPSKEAFIYLVDSDAKKFVVPTLDKTIPNKIDKESIISECLKSKQAFLVNDVARSFLYNKKIDNYFDFDIKDILVVPFIDESDEKNVFAILWMAIIKGSWNQYTQKDLEYITRFSTTVNRLIKRKNFEETGDIEYDWLFDCLKSHEELNYQMKKERDYFSSIIHDVRTPMSSVIGFLELLNQREDDRGKKEYIKTALKSAETMVALINDVLDISKMASGKMDIEQVEFSVFNELSDVSNLFHNTASEKGINLITYYDPHIPNIISSDYHRIKQVMNNLLSNAIKFTSKNGEINLEIIYDKKRDGITISIKDSGIGIAEDMQNSIFTPYTQEKCSTSREYGGTGLGLSISQQLAVLLGGKLELESKEGEGSKFFFTIPCNTPDSTKSLVDTGKLKNFSVIVYNPKDEVTTQTVYRYLNEFGLELELIQSDNKLHLLLEMEFDILVISRDETILYEDEIQKILKKGKLVLIVGDGYFNEDYHWFDGEVRRINAPILAHKLYDTVIDLASLDDKVDRDKKLAKDIEKIAGKNILVIDDNMIILKFMKEVLKSLDLQSKLAQGAEDGLDEFKSKQYDMVLIDENMPTMKGSEAIELIREMEINDNLHHTTVISITGNSDKKTIDRIYTAGADDVLTKPVQIDILKKMILKYL